MFEYSIENFALSNIHHHIFSYVALAAARLLACLLVVSVSVVFFVKLAKLLSLTVTETKWGVLIISVKPGENGDTSLVCH